MNKDYIVIPKAVSEELCKFIALEFSMMEIVFKNLYPGAKLSDLCDNTFARYSPLMIEALGVHIQPMVEAATNLQLCPTYSYARIYYEGSELAPHIDRASSEITVSVCLEKEVDWPLYIRGTNRIHEINLEVGDMVVYCGRKHEHWRKPLVGKQQIQAFLQYVNAKGDDAWLKWDTRACLGLPFEYASQAVQNQLKKKN